MRLGALCLIAAAGLALAGCGSTKPIAASDGQVGDGSDTLISLPLSVPPGYYAPPLQAAAATSQQGAQADQTQTASVDAAPSPGQTPGESAFLEAAGANSADPNIRAEIDQSAMNRAADPALVEKLLFGPSTPPAAAGGPSVTRSKPGVLDTLF